MDEADGASPAAQGQVEEVAEKHRGIVAFRRVGGSGRASSANRLWRWRLHWRTTFAPGTFLVRRVPETRTFPVPY